MLHYTIHSPLHSSQSAAIDPNHTHFLLIDDGRRGNYGGEIKFRTDLEEQLSSSMRIPKASLLV